MKPLAIGIDLKISEMSSRIERTMGISSFFKLASSKFNVELIFAWSLLWIFFSVFFIGNFHFPIHLCVISKMNWIQWGNTDHMRCYLSHQIRWEIEKDNKSALQFPTISKSIASGRVPAQPVREVSLRRRWFQALGSSVLKPPSASCTSPVKKYLRKTRNTQTNYNLIARTNFPGESRMKWEQFVRSTFPSKLCAKLSTQSKQRECSQSGFVFDLNGSWLKRQSFASIWNWSKNLSHNFKFFLFKISSSIKLMIIDYHWRFRKLMSSFTWRKSWENPIFQSTLWALSVLDFIHL